MFLKQANFLQGIFKPYERRLKYVKYKFCFIFVSCFVLVWEICDQKFVKRFAFNISISYSHVIFTHLSFFLSFSLSLSLSLSLISLKFFLYLFRSLLLSFFLSKCFVFLFLCLSFFFHSLSLSLKFFVYLFRSLLLSFSLKCFVFILICWPFFFPSLLTFKSLFGDCDDLVVFDDPSKNPGKVQRFYKNIDWKALK